MGVIMALHKYRIVKFFLKGGNDIKTLFDSRVVEVLNKSYSSEEDCWELICLVEQEYK